MPRKDEPKFKRRRKEEAKLKRRLAKKIKASENITMRRIERSPKSGREPLELSRIASYDYRLSAMPPYNPPSCCISELEESVRAWFKKYTQTIATIKLNPPNIYNFAIKTYYFNAGKNFVHIIECGCSDAILLKPYIITAEESPEKDLEAQIAMWSDPESANNDSLDSHVVNWLEKIFLPDTKNKAKDEYRMIVAEGAGVFNEKFMKETIDNYTSVFLSARKTVGMVFPLEALFFKILNRRLHDNGYDEIKTLGQFWEKYQAARTVAALYISTGWEKCGMCPIHLDYALGELRESGIRKHIAYQKRILETEKEKEPEEAEKKEFVGIYTQERATDSNLYNSRPKSPIKPMED